MKVKNYYSITVLLVIFLSILGSVENLKSEILDRIAAVVGTEIILESEIAQIIEQQQNYIKEGTDKKDIRAKVLESMISSKVLYDIAINDTTIIVSEDEIESILEERVRSIVANVGGEDILMQKYNTTVSKLKMEYRADIKRSVFVDRLKGSKLRKVKISRREVEEFYESNKDSLPEIKENVTLSNLVVGFNSKAVSDEQTFRAAANIEKEILEGTLTFEEAAKKYSEDSSSEKGGDIGTTNRGDLVSEYEKAAYGLKIGEMTGPIKTEFGYHLIKLTELNGEKIRTSHILIKFKIKESGFEEALKTVLSIKDSISNKFMTFEEAVKRYSDDEKSKMNDGRIGTLNMEDMDAENQSTFRELQIGEISEPFKKENGYYIFKLLDKQEKHLVALSTDYSRIKDWALNKKRDKELQNWVEKLKERVFIEVK